MGNVSLQVRQLAPVLYLSICEVIQLTFMDMDFGVWKIWQPADVVKVHVSNDDVFHIFRFVSQLFDTIDGGFIGIERHLSDNAEQSGEPGWVGVIVQPESGIDQS